MKKALLLTLLMLFALELVVRLLLFPASEDFVRFGTYDERAASLTRSEAFRVAVIGNSAAEEGIDPRQLEAVLSSRLARPVRVEMFCADGSEIVTWHAMLERYFWRTDAQADVFVLNYLNSVADTSHFEFIRVGMFFTGPAQWPYYLRTQMTSVSERLEFILSSSLAAYGARDRLRDRILLTIIPGYSSLVSELNDVRTGESIAPRLPQAKRFSALDQIVAQAESRNALVVLSAFPLRGGRYEIERELVQRAELGKLQVIDAQTTLGLSAEDYRDDIHLVARGRRLFTAHLGDRLASLLAGQP